jgi:hypothetical protein
VYMNGCGKSGVLSHVGCSCKVFGLNAQSGLQLPDEWLESGSGC